MGLTDVEGQQRTNIFAARHRASGRHFSDCITVIVLVKALRQYVVHIDLRTAVHIVSISESYNSNNLSLKPELCHVGLVIYVSVLIVLEIQREPQERTQITSE